MSAAPRACPLSGSPGAHRLFVVMLHLNTLLPSMFMSLFSIDDTLQVKITDNALSRDLFPMDYHCLGDNENRPVRWMALESLVNNEFSSASDVVSTGAQVNSM